MSKNFIFIIFIIFVLCNGITFDRTYGDTTGEVANGVKVTHDGGYVIVGSTGASGTGFEQWYRDGYIIKIDEFGEIEWEKTYGDTLNEFFVDVCQTNDDGYVAIGGQDDGWIPSRFLMVKFDKFGKEKWNISFTDSTTSYIASSVMVDPNSEEIIVVGSIYDPAYAFNNDAWVMKVDKLGNVVWSNIIDRGDLLVNANSIIPHTSGYLVCGMREVLVYNGPFVVPEYSAISQGWIFLMDNAGNIIDEYKLSNDFFTCFNSIITTSDNNIIASGYCKKTIEMKDYPNNRELILVKVTDSLQEIWQKYFSDMNSDYTKTGVCLDSDDNYAVIGTTNQNESNQNDIWYMKFDNNGNEIWQRTYGCTENEFSGNNIIPLSDGFVFTGTVDKASIYQNDYYVTGDICLVKTDQFGNVIYPPAITHFENDSNNVSINWEAVSNAGSYIVYGSDRPDSNFTAIDTTSVNLWNSIEADSLKKKFYYIKASTNAIGK